MKNTDHLAALYTRLSNETARQSDDNSELRLVCIDQIKKEIYSEEQFLGINEIDNEMSDAELLAELEA